MPSFASHRRFAPFLLKGIFLNLLISLIGSPLSLASSHSATESQVAEKTPYTKRVESSELNMNLKGNPCIVNRHHLADSIELSCETSQLKCVATWYRGGPNANLASLFIEKKSAENEKVLEILWPERDIKMNRESLGSTFRFWMEKWCDGEFKEIRKKLDILKLGPAADKNGDQVAENLLKKRFFKPSLCYGKDYSAHAQTRCAEGTKGYFQSDSRIEMHPYQEVRANQTCLKRIYEFCSGTSRY